MTVQRSLIAVVITGIRARSSSPLRDDHWPTEEQVKSASLRREKRMLLRLVSILILRFVMVWKLLVATHALGPPRASVDLGDERRIFEEGSSAVLPCPVHAGDPDNLFFQWFRGNEPLTAFDRMRITSTGALKMKEAEQKDTGHYTCRAINGFGSADVNITLIVLDQEEYAAWARTFNKTKGTRKYLEPPALNATEAISDLERQVGESVKLKCLATGRPQPSISWYKDGEPINRKKKGRWSLNLQNLQLNHRGNYTCVVRNVLGFTSSTFYLNVIDEFQRKPELSAIRPQNATVTAGSMATLLCVVRSHLLPHVQWLQRVEEMRGDTIAMQGEAFKVIKSSEMIERSDNHYLNKLLIPKAKEEDSGKYVCLGANSMGYSYKSTYLTVLPVSEQLYVGQRKFLFDIPLSLVISTSVTLGVIVSLVLSLCFMCRHKKEESPVAVQEDHVYKTGSTDVTQSISIESNSGSFQCQSNWPFLYNTASTDKEKLPGIFGNGSSYFCKQNVPKLLLPSTTNVTITEDFILPWQNPLTLGSQRKFSN